jgi:hypothetical protein
MSSGEDKKLRDEVCLLIAKQWLVLSSVRMSNVQLPISTEIRLWKFDIGRWTLNSGQNDIKFFWPGALLLDCLLPIAYYLLLTAHRLYRLFLAREDRSLL